MSLLTLNGKRLKRKYKDISKLSTVLLDDLADKGIIMKFDGITSSEPYYIEHFEGTVNLFDDRVKCEYDCCIIYDRKVDKTYYRTWDYSSEACCSAQEWRLELDRIVGRVNFKILKLNYSLGGDEYHINLDSLSHPTIRIAPCYIPTKHGSGFGMVEVDLEEIFNEENKMSFAIQPQKCVMSINTPVFASKSYNDSDVLIFSERQQKWLEEEMVCDLCKTEISKIIQEQCPTFETIERMALGGHTLQEEINKRCAYNTYYSKLSKDRLQQLYDAYMLKSLFVGIDDMIETRSLSFDEFCEAVRTGEIKMNEPNQITI